MKYLFLLHTRLPSLIGYPGLCRTLPPLLSPKRLVNSTETDRGGKWVKYWFPDSEVENLGVKGALILLVWVTIPVFLSYRTCHEPCNLYELTTIDL